MISFIRQAIIKKYPNYCSKATKRRFKLFTPNNEWIFLKKLRNNRRPSNIETAANNIILHQYTENERDKAPNIFLGYTEANGYSMITGIYAVCIDGKDILWHTDISTLEIRETGILVSTKPKNDGPKLKDGVVKVKKTKRK